MRVQTYLYLMILLGLFLGDLENLKCTSLISRVSAMVSVSKVLVSVSKAKVSVSKVMVSVSKTMVLVSKAMVLVSKAYKPLNFAVKSSIIINILSYKKITLPTKFMIICLIS